MENGAAIAENNLQVPQNINCCYDPAIPLLGIYARETKTLCSHKDLYMNLHSKIICNSQNPSTDEWTNMAYLCKGLLFSNNMA